MSSKCSRHHIKKLAARPAAVGHFHRNTFAHRAALERLEAKHHLLGKANAKRVQEIPRRGPLSRRAGTTRRVVSRPTGS